MGIFFSVAGFFHQYYMTVMAPAIAALFGIGLVTMWQDYRRGSWRGWLLPIALIVTAAEQVYILTSYPTWGQVLIPIIVVLSVIALVSTRIAPLLKVKALRARMLLPALALGVLALLITPTVWAAIPVFTSTQADTLVGGPAQESGFGGNFGGGRGESASTNSALVRYLEAHQGTAKFLVAVTSSTQADSLILATNKPVMTLGGFSGSDPILTTDQLATLVKNGTVRYFLLDSFSGGGPGGSTQSVLITWIKQHSKEVPTSQWQSSSTSSGFGGAVQLYEYTGTP
jgi:4-amino-4-deoxy-L-arabinose transferase-like glycosyltransferase